jgi:hypothetical protein
LLALQGRKYSTPTKNKGFLNPLFVKSTATGGFGSKEMRHTTSLQYNPDNFANPVKIMVQTIFAK